MAVEMVNAVTNEKLKEMDWMKSIKICELVARDPGQAKDVVKTIKKRLGKKNADTQLFSVMLLEMLMNNCGEPIHKQVIDNGLLPVLVKIVKKKTDVPVRERIFILLDATQTSLGGVSGRFPQYYAAYYELVSARVQFPQMPRLPAEEAAGAPTLPKESPANSQLPQKCENGVKQANSSSKSDTSIAEKAAGVLNVLRDVLNALDPKCPQGAADVFVLDLVEQCSFQKQWVMHLAMTSGEEKVVTRAIELNEELDKVLAKHDSLLSVRATATTTISQEAEEEDEERLFRRIRKGKACMEDTPEGSLGSFKLIPEDKFLRPRPLCIYPVDSDGRLPAAGSIPPPPAKQVEREKFFKEKQQDTSALPGHLRGLSLNSRNGSSSIGGSSDFSELGFRDS